MAAIPNEPIQRDAWMEWLAFNQFWGLVIVGAALCLALTDIIVHEFRPPPPPYVLVTNMKGEPLARLQPIVGTANIPDQVTRWFLREFVENAFTIDNSFGEEADIRMPKVYTVMPKNSQAEKALTDWYKADGNANNPIIQYNKGWQEAHVLRTLKLPEAGTYEAHFQTVRHSTADQGTITKNYRIIMHEIVAQPTQANELGLFIDSIDLKEQ